MKNKGFIKNEKSKRIDNIPDSGILTGYYEIDFYGCWWEYIQDKDNKKAWIIGEYPMNIDIEIDRS